MQQLFNSPDMAPERTLETFYAYGPLPVNSTDLGLGDDQQENFSLGLDASNNTDLRLMGATSSTDLGLEEDTTPPRFDFDLDNDNDTSSFVIAKNLEVLAEQMTSAGMYSAAAIVSALREFI